MKSEIVSPCTRAKKITRYLEKIDLHRIEWSELKEASSCAKERGFIVFQSEVK